MRVTRAQTSEPPTYQMKQYKKKYDIQDEFEDNQCIKAKLQDANEHLEEVKQNSMEYRAEFLQLMAQKYSNANNTPLEKAITSILT